jgi:hypothetical protein
LWSKPARRAAEGSVGLRANPHALSQQRRHDLGIESYSLL